MAQAEVVKIRKLGEMGEVAQAEVVLREMWNAQLMFGYPQILQFPVERRKLSWCNVKTFKPYTQIVKATQSVQSHRHQFLIFHSDPNNAIMLILFSRNRVCLRVLTPLLLGDD